MRDKPDAVAPPFDSPIVSTGSSLAHWPSSTPQPPPATPSSFLPPMSANDPPYPSPNRSFADVNLVWLDGSETFASLAASEVIVYEFIAKVEPVHSSDIQRTACVEKRTARDALQTLRETDLIEKQTDPNHPNNPVYVLAKSATRGE